MTPREALERGAQELALGLREETRERLLAYLALMAKWNKTYNLTAVRDPLAMVSHHLLDSLAALPHLAMPPSGALADVGSGAGLPGIPLAIVRPDWKVALAEASGKKAAFLRQATIELGLRNAEVHEGRVESWRPAERFPVVISRAFARLAQFARACAHLVTREGCLVAMKGALRPDELAEMAAWRCAAVALRVPFLDAARHLVICRRDEALAAA
ncbi:MAG TPA: 16S rRNA (guanine(527)-N(7))-methyltransferase RsmG [Burkholderiales bacterium]